LKVTIIGSNGFLGMNLGEYLRREGVEVIGCSSTGGGGIDPRSGLFPDTFSIQRETDAVVYLAQSPYYRVNKTNLEHLWNVNVLSALRAGELSREANVKRFIYASTGNVYSPQFSPLSEDSPLRRDDWYVLSKIHAEEILSLFKRDLNITIMRLFGIYGTGQKDKIIPNIIKTVIQEQEVYVEKNPLNPDDHNGLRVSFCYIDDLVGIIAKLLYLDGPLVLNIAGEKGISIREVATSIASFVGKKVSVKVLDRVREGDLIADIALLKEVVCPQFTPLQQGLAKTIEFELQNQQSWIK